MNDIDVSFECGKNFKIGQFNIIEEDVIVGDNVTIENHVTLKNGTRIGNHVFVDSYVRSSGNNLIGNWVTLRFGATIAREVVIEDNVFISPNVMTIYSTAGGQIVPGIKIKKGAFIGTSAVIGPGLIVEKEVTLGVMSYLTHDADIQGGVYTGVPATFKRVKYA